MKNKIKSSVKGLKDIIQEVSKVRSIGERRYQTDWEGPYSDDDNSFDAIASDIFFGTWRISDIEPICQQQAEAYDFKLDRSSKGSKLIGKKINRIDKAVKYTQRVLYPKFKYEYADFTDTENRVIYVAFWLPKPIRSIDSDEVLRFRDMVKDKRKFDKVIDKFMKTKGEFYLCFNVVFEVLDTDDGYLSYLDDADCTEWHLDGVVEYFDRYMNDF